MANSSKIDLSGKTAIVRGAGGGIGNGIVHALVACDAKVVALLPMTV